MISRKELRYFQMPSPVGTLLVVLTDKGVLEIRYDALPVRHLASLAKRISTSTPPARVYGEFIEDELKKYFRAELAYFRTPVDLGLCPPFSAQVLLRLAALTPGKLTSYGELAQEVGKPKAARAVGQAVGSNPIPIIIPCHRVLAADGSLGGYSGGLPRKRTLLEIEGIRPPRGGWAPRRRGKLAD